MTTSTAGSQARRTGPLKWRPRPPTRRGRCPGPGIAAPRLPARGRAVHGRGALRGPPGRCRVVSRPGGGAARSDSRCRRGEVNSPGTPPEAGPPRLGARGGGCAAWLRGQGVGPAQTACRGAVPGRERHTRGWERRSVSSLRSERCCEVGHTGMSSFLSLGKAGR